MPEPKAYNTSDTKYLNKSLILRFILQEQALSRRSLVEITGLSAPTITVLTNELINEGFVVEGDYEDSKDPRGGRKRQLLELSCESYVAVGINLGAPHGTIGLVDLCGNVIAEHTLTEEHTRQASTDSLHYIATTVEAMLRENNISDQLLGIGVGYPGLPSGWVPILETLQDYFDVPIVIENNVRAMALGEYYFGRQENVRGLAFIYIGKGIGSGIILDGELWNGYADGAGKAIGHFRVTNEKVLCRCGNFGCLEAIVGEAALIQQLRSSFKDLQDVVDDDVIDQFKQMATDGVEEAVQIMDKISDTLYTATSAIAHIINPELIVFAGKLFSGNSYIIDKMRQTMSQRTEHGVERLAEMDTTHLGSTVAAIGAASLVLLDQVYFPKKSRTSTT